MTQSGQLFGWKAIAGCIGVSVRTAQEYERTRGLPVRHMPGIRGRVFADAADLTAWRNRGPVVDYPQEEKGDLAEAISVKFGDHRQYVGLISAVYGLLYAEALLLEIAYQFDQFGLLALAAAPAVFVWIASTTICALYINWRQVAHLKGGGLLFSAVVVYVSALLLQVAMTWILPSMAVTQQLGRQAQSAQAAYFKNIVLYFLPLASVYLLLPFHFVLALQQDLEGQKYSEVAALLMAERRAVAPAGTVFLRIWWLAVALAVVAVLSMVMTQDLFDHLRPGRFMNLFMLLVLARCLLYFGLGLLCLLWYARALNEIKRECMRREGS